MTKTLHCVGAITGAHGVRGQLTVKAFTDNVDALPDYGPLFTSEDGKASYELKFTGKSRGLQLAKIDGVTSREQAEVLKGTTLYVPREVLPELDEEELFYDDLIGLEVREGGKKTGTVKAVHQFGAGDALELRLDGTPPRMEYISFNKESVPVVSVSGGYVDIIWPDEEIVTEQGNDD